MKWLILIAGIFNLFLGLLVLSRNKKSKLNILFFLFGVSSAMLCFFDFFFRFFPRVEIVRFSYAFAAIIPNFAVLWAYELMKKKISKIRISLLLFIAIIAFAVTSSTDLVVKKVLYLSYLGYRGEFGSFFSAYSIYILIIILFIIYKLYSERRKAHSLYKTQLTYVLSGLLLYGAGASIFSLILPLIFNNYSLTLLDAPSSIFFVASSSYAIVRYRLMGIRTIASKIYTYFVVALYAYSFFYMAVFIEEFFFGSIYDSGALIFGPMLAFVFAITFLPFFKKIQESSDVIFFHGYNPRSIIKDVALQLSAVINLDELLKIISAEFKKILATEEVNVMLFENDNSCHSIYKGDETELNPKNSICTHVLRDKGIIVRDEINPEERKYLSREMDKLKAKVIAPLMTRYKILGMIIIGEKMDGSPYTKEDIEFLEIISSQAAVAIENARLYTTVEDFNKTLQQKVDVQTKELADKAEHLQKLMDMRSEFLDITSHQLRTPVAVIKGVLSMLQEGSIPKKKLKEFIRGALDKSMKLGEIINDILRASEMDTDKFTMTLASVDINPMLEKIKDDKLRTSTKAVKLIFNLPKDPLPEVLTNEKYIEQCILNLVNNSFQYTVEGSITVSAEVTKDSVIIRVADTGIGIPEKDRSKLFQKFGRAENAVQTFTDGSGLGLFIIKQVVEATPGAKIEIEKTEVNVGTTFALTLPIATAVVQK